MKTGATPVVAPLRRYPIQLRDEIINKLAELEELSIIEPVDGPTEWVNQLAFATKKNNELRVCQDPKHLNLQMNRIHNKMPTLDEITHKFAGAKVFSKLDAKHVYWAIHLDDDSKLSRVLPENSDSANFRSG